MNENIRGIDYFYLKYSLQQDREGAQKLEDAGYNVATFYDYSIMEFFWKELRAVIVSYFLFSVGASLVYTYQGGISAKK